MIEVNFKDRVPTNPGRVTLTPVTGQNNTYDMARADNPTEAGTPLDKATFDSIIQSRLTGRYYVPTVTRTTVSSQTGITANPIPTSWTQQEGLKMISGGYTAEASNVYGTATVSRALDGNDNTYYSSTSLTTAWISVKLPQSIVLKKIKLKCIAYSTLSTKVQGSGDGSNWSDLLTISGSMAVKTEYTLTNTGNYQYYRLLFTVSPADEMQVYTWEFSSYDIVTYANALSVASGLPTSWTSRQRLMVEIPASVSTLGVVSNTLNGKNVNTILQPNKRYELRYTGTAFVAKEV